jgi:hypothetical protein
MRFAVPLNPGSRPPTRDGRSNGCHEAHDEWSTTVRCSAVLAHATREGPGACALEDPVDGRCTTSIGLAQIRAKGNKATVIHKVARFVHRRKPLPCGHLQHRLPVFDQQRADLDNECLRPFAPEVCECVGEFVGSGARPEQVEYPDSVQCRGPPGGPDLAGCSLECAAPFGQARSCALPKQASRPTAPRWRPTRRSGRVRSARVTPR